MPLFKKKYITPNETEFEQATRQLKKALKKIDVLMVSYQGDRYPMWARVREILKDYLRIGVKP